MKSEWKLIASSGLSAKEMKALISKYWYRRPDEDCIEITFKADEKPPYKVLQDGKIMDGFRVVVKGGRYRFEGLTGGKND